MIRAFLYITSLSVLMYTGCTTQSSNQKTKDTDTNLTNMSEITPTIETQMLIRKPVEEVYQAFVDPSITTNFWFTKSSGPLIEGSSVQWDWEMYNVTVKVDVIELKENEKIIYKWGSPSTIVQIEFNTVSDQSTYVIIKNHGFELAGDELIAAIKDGTGGFTTVLDGLKAYLEHGINLNLIRDKFPLEITQHGN